MIESDLQVWKEPLRLPAGRKAGGRPERGGMEPPGRDKQCLSQLGGQLDGRRFLGVIERWEKEGLETEQRRGKLSLSWRGCCRWSCPSGCHWPGH